MGEDHAHDRDLDADLVEKAQAYTGITERSLLLREALAALIQREAARRAIKLGGTDPTATPAPRKRLPAA